MYISCYDMKLLLVINMNLYVYFLNYFMFIIIFPSAFGILLFDLFLIFLLVYYYCPPLFISISVKAESRITT